MKYAKIDPAVKAEWCAALRSGDYKQGTGYLKRIPKGETECGYCCLGVLSEISGDLKSKSEGGMFRSSLPGESHNMVTEGYMGLDRPAIDVLWRMNDLQRVDFNGIADWIEENL